VARPDRSFPTQPIIPPGGERRDPAATLDELIEELLAHPGFAPSIARVHRQPAVPATWGEWPADLAPGLIAALRQRGMERPYSHQAVAIAHAIAGRHAVTITPTASGKSICYNVPVVEALLKDREARALYLFPTKALSHDQYRELYDLTQAAGGDIKVFTYDGDTPPATRRALRESGHLIVSNPDMLHAGILPHHTGWIKLFRNLKYVVLDELHQYRGVFGSHVANVMRRLQRLCKFYGSSPTFLASSATIANAGELAQELTGLPFEVVAESGAPRGPRTILFFNPPVINKELNVRRSVRLEVRRLAIRFLSRNHQVLVFGRSRLDVEVMTTYLKRGMARLHRDPEQIAGYRSGYLPTERREIENGLKQRKLLGVVSTNALELGVDVGSLDVSILAGWPGTVASAWQQAGRAGRKGASSLAIYIAGSTPLDQFLMNHPDYFLGASPERGIVNPENLVILASHLKCAAFELPFDEEESFGPTDPGPILQYLEDEKVLRHTEKRWYYSSDSYPAEDISLRSAAGENFIVLDTGRQNKVIAEVDFDSAPFLLHDDAVYIHNAKTYLVEKLDWDRRTAYVRHKVIDYYTDAESSSELRVLDIDEEQPSRASALVEARRFGPVSVTTVIAKFKKVKFETQESIGYGPVNVPPLEIQTEAAWLTLQPNAAEVFKAQGHDLGNALQGAAGLLRHTVPLQVLCDRSDFSVSAMLRAPFDQRPTIYMWDRYPGGIGLSRRFFALERPILEACLTIVRECTCADGCPSCIGARLEKDGAAKRATTALLEALLKE